MGDRESEEKERDAFSRESYYESQAFFAAQGVHSSGLHSATSAPLQKGD
jgi:hypothetical protein